MCVQLLAGCRTVAISLLIIQAVASDACPKKQLPNNISIPDMLNMQGQVARCYVETYLQKFVTDILQRLRGLLESELQREFKDLED